jgi:hypothetical protein
LKYALGKRAPKQLNDFELDTYSIEAFSSNNKTNETLLTTKRDNNFIE